jgi:epoxyqueuosine reductase
MDRLRQALLSAGADLVGYADLSALDPACRADLPYGVAIGIGLDPAIVKAIPTGTVIRQYGDEYDRVNARLESLCRMAAETIAGGGYRALAQTIAFVREQNPIRAPLPHKTVAALAGFGWIAKNSLLITPQFGSALRLTTVLTDMPLETRSHAYSCLCGACTLCVDACPGYAIRDKNWDASVDRDELVDRKACREFVLARGKAYGRTSATCGICIAVCPYTERHL